MGEPHFSSEASPLVDTGARSYGLLRSSDAPPAVEVRQLAGDGINTATYYASRDWTFGGDLSANGCFHGERRPPSKTGGVPGVFSELVANAPPETSTESSPRNAYRKPEELVCSRDAKRHREDDEYVCKIYKRNVEEKMNHQDRGSSVFSFGHETVENGTCEAAAGPNSVLDDNSGRQMVEQVYIPVQVFTEGPSSSPNNFISEISFSSSEDDETSVDVKEPKDKNRKKSSSKKMIYFFQELMKQVMMKQESLQKQLMDTLEKRENERIAREEAWKQQKMEAMRQNYEMWAQERACAASRDFGLISLLEKFMHQQNDLSKSAGISQMEQDWKEKIDPNHNAFHSTKEHHSFPEDEAHCELQTAGQQIHLERFSKCSYVEECRHKEDIRHNNGCDTSCSYYPSSKVQAHIGPQSAEEQLHLPNSAVGEGKTIVGINKKRWPSSEVQALIKLRIAFEHKFQTKTPRDQLWQEISRDLSSMGYSHSGKKCKEKWENINKYFKKAKICGKLQSKNLSMCSYFRELDIFYEHGYQYSDNHLEEDKSF
ncbi:trihelix transcription factor GTL1-like [Aristolochia californica]|uniref:trihelix transcription factor GTL1-like n=1 Tax=Aristolochia californica TaxID=171875 RepID=UPI0035E30276